jgi:hypothetical protein
MIDGSSLALPPTWSQAGEEIFCLGCSRARAEDAAIESASEDCSRKDLVRIRRQGLIEFELERCPEAPNQTIARTCHTSTAAVAAVRDAAAEPAGKVAELSNSFENA